MIARFRKHPWFLFPVLVLAVTGLAFGISKLKAEWKMMVNGHKVAVPVHEINGGYFVSLNDLAKLPGWKVTVDLSTREVSVDTPGKIEPPKSAWASKRKRTAFRTAAAPQEPATVAAEVKTGQPSGPPSDVGMTVQAAVASLTDLQNALNSNAGIDAVKQKRDSASQTMRQAQNLLWTIPRTRTLQADLQVAFEDLDSQVSLLDATSQAQDGILPWTHPTAQNLLMKYPDLRPCHVTKDKTDGLDIDCAKRIMSESSGDDFTDISRDLGQYK